MTSLCGVPTAAACFLLPVGVVLYTMFGGIKATFLTDYVHTVVILAIIFLFAFTAYATSNVLGSPGAVYDALVAASERHPVEGNAGGSYLTMKSQEGEMQTANYTKMAHTHTPISQAQSSSSSILWATLEPSSWTTVGRPLMSNLRTVER